MIGRPFESLILWLAATTQELVKVMVFAAIIAGDRSPLVFIDYGIEINFKYYRENILEKHLKSGHSKISVTVLGQYNRTQNHCTQLALNRSG